MAYRYGNRYQKTLSPQSIEKYVADDSPVRAYDAFVEALDFIELGIDIDPDKVGNSEYDPKAMLKLLVYGYSYGVKSSRKLERETHNIHQVLEKFKKTEREKINLTRLITILGVSGLIEKLMALRVPAFG